MSKLGFGSAKTILFLIPPLVGLFLLGGALARLLYETAFPTLSVAQSHLLAWAGAGGLALILAVRHRSRPTPLGWTDSLPFLPLWLNGWYLFQPQTSVNLLAGWLALAGSLYTAVFSTLLLHQRPRGWLARLAWLIVPLALVYLLTLGRTVGEADTFEFQVVVPQLGIVHPTGYPLYLLLGKLWTVLVPVGQLAWRLNLATAVYALLAAALLYWLIWQLLHRLAPAHTPATLTHTLTTTAALVATFAYALSSTFWSQAIEAEVYTLHNLFVALILALTLSEPQQVLKNNAEGQRSREAEFSLGIFFFSAFSVISVVQKLFGQYRFILLAFLLGLGLTNHLTTIILFPAVGLAFLFSQFNQGRDWRGWSPLLKQLAQMALAFVLPLTLYAYLPLRWQAVNNEPMGLERFLGWVTGSQFQGALQLRAWLADPTRYEVVGRLFLNEWGWWGLALAALGLVFVAWRNWRVALMLAVTWLGFVFYCLNYYVPDLNVFLLPAHLVTAVFMAAGLSALVFIPPPAIKPAATGLLPLLLLLPLGADVVQTWPQVDQSQDRALTQWGTAVLRLPLDPHALILADSEKIAPLYYLQRAEGLRPDLDIRVLPDEAAYRSALGEAIAQGQTVYLARFIPGLEGAYHLRSLGPLTEVSTTPQSDLPNTAVSPSPAPSFNVVQLRGYEITPSAPEADFHTAVTLHWQATQPITVPLKIYVRWAGHAPLDPTGRHPVHDYYPITAWKGAEIVTDYQLLPHPYPRPATADLQVALAPPFTPPEALAWQTVTAVDLSHIEGQPTYDTAVRQRFGADAWVTSVDMPAQMRPLAEGQTPPVRLAGQGVADLSLAGTAVGDTYALTVARDGHTAVCGWSLNPFAPTTNTCPLGDMLISGVPIPAGATNFGDQIALLNVQPDSTTLTPGGQLSLTLTWQALGPIREDYTVFVQLLNPAGELVAQVDAWPLQGTYPTSAWATGETITDPYQLALSPDLPPGEYELIVGFYRLADLQRLPVLDVNGVPLDDKHRLPGLVVPVSG